MPEPSASRLMNYPTEAATIMKSKEKKTHIRYPGHQDS